MRLAEEVATEFVNFIRDRFELKLVTINDEFEDGIVCELPQAYFISEKDVESVPNWPAVLVLVPDITVEDWSTDYIDPSYTVTIGVLHLEQDSEVLKRKLYRYMKAIFEIMVEAATTESGFDWIPLGQFRFNYQPIYSQANDFVSDAQMTITVQGRNAETL